MFVLSIDVPIEISDPVHAFCADGLQQLASLGGPPLRVVLNMVHCNLLCDEPGAVEDTLLEVFHELGEGIPSSEISKNDNLKMQQIQRSLDRIIARYSS